MNKNGFFLVTLGCKVNQYESQALREAWTARGLEEAMTAKDARTVCVSTCAVTAKAVADGRAAVRRTHRDNPDAEIVITGCAAEVLREEFAELPGVTLVVPQTEKAALLRREEDFPAEDAPGHPPAYPAFAISGYDRARAVIKVQDGCSHRCTYCIVPLARGRSRSRLPEETLAEAERLLAAGFRELVLNGINLAQYGRDLAEPHDFWDLATFLERRLAPEWAGRARIRLSSLEPGQLGQKALDTLGKSRLIAPHLHLSLQSGSPEVLRRMGRGHYDPGVLPGFFRNLSAIFPRFGLGADLLSGFPGETEDHAAETEALCTELPFSYAHVFPYSRRPGTPAADWPDRVGSRTRKERAARLRAIVEAKKQAFLAESLALETMRVACEPTGDRTVSGGVNEFYAECRFVEGLALHASSARLLVAAKPVGMENGYLRVERLEE